MTTKMDAPEPREDLTWDDQHVYRAEYRKWLDTLSLAEVKEEREEIRSAAREEIVLAGGLQNPKTDLFAELSWELMWVNRRIKKN